MKGRSPYQVYLLAWMAQFGLTSLNLRQCRRLYAKFYETITLPS